MICATSGNFIADARDTFVPVDLCNEFLQFLRWRQIRVHVAAIRAFKDTINQFRFTLRATACFLGVLAARVLEEEVAHDAAKNFTVAVAAWRRGVEFGVGDGGGVLD